MRSQFSLKLLLSLAVFSCVVSAVVAYVLHMRWRSDIAKQRLAAFCADKGGNFVIDLVDGDARVHLRSSRLSMSDLRNLASLLQQCVSHDLGGDCDVHLDFSHAKVDGDLFVALSKNVVGLSVAGLSLDDDDVERIASVCPRLQYLDLDDTKITDASISDLAGLPLRSLSLRHNDISLRGLRGLEESNNLYELRVTLAEDDIESLRSVLPGCEVSQ